ncbi:hypothetical protein JL720_2244 [Aureococcus anophagefferens]|nr:hypothetical protein JL720_2244 [Aureococcus anophagefferens]
MKEILAASKRAMSTEGMGSLETLLEKIEEKRRSSLTPVEAKDEDAAACANPGTPESEQRRVPEGRRRGVAALEAAIDDDDVDAKMFHLDRLLGAVLSVAKVEMGVDRCCFYSGSDLISRDAASRRDVVGDAAIDDGDRASACKEDGEGEVLHVAGRASDQGERRTTRIVEVGAFNDFDCAGPGPGGRNREVDGTRHRGEA